MLKLSAKNVMRNYQVSSQSDARHSVPAGEVNGEHFHEPVVLNLICMVCIALNLHLLGSDDW